MRKQHDRNDTKIEADSETNSSTTRPPEPRSDESQAGHDEGLACSSITLALNSHGEVSDCQWEALNGKAGLDYFETASTIHWTKASRHWFDLLAEAKAKAQEDKKPVAVPIGSDIVSVEASGRGSGRDAYKEFSVTWQDVRVALSERNDATRQMSNGHLIVSGRPCLLIGVAAARTFLHRLIATMGGVVTDEWMRRIDLCIDVPGLNFTEDVYPLLQRRQFTSRCRGRHFHEDQDKATGFHTGNSKRLRVLVYDKLQQVIGKLDPVYFAAMQQRRWRGITPCATRFEWQIGRAYLKQYGLDTAHETLQRLPDLYEKLTGEPNAAFRLLECEPDRENSHQSRVLSHPIWNRVVAIGHESIEAGTQRLKPIDRESLDETRTTKQAVGLVTSAAVRGEVVVETLADLARHFEVMCRRSGVTDADVADIWLRKAKETGAYSEIFSFPGKEAA